MCAWCQPKGQWWKRSFTLASGPGTDDAETEDGSAIPFGAQVTVNGQDGSADLVDTDSEVYLTGLADKGELTVKWGAQQCRVNYHLPAHKGIAGLYQMSGLCR